MKNIVSILPLLFLYLPLQAGTLHIGSGQPYPDLMSAVN